MGGIGYAIAAGIGFGVFQAFNRLALQSTDAYRATFRLLLVGSSALALWTVATQDLGLLLDAPLNAVGSFAAAGVIHFFFGWTFLSLSQQRIGASATSAVVALNPLIATLLAALVLAETVTWVALLGVVVVIGGVIVLSVRRAPGAFGERLFPWFAVAAALAWGSSPLFIRWGLAEIPAPLIGVTIGLLSATIMYAAALGVTRRRRSRDETAPALLRWSIIAGLLVAASITWQWIAFDLIAIAIAITLMQLAVPTVIVVAPLLVGTSLEKPTPSLLLGAGAVVTGSVLVVLAGTT